MAKNTFFRPGRIIREFEVGGNRVVFRCLKPSDAVQGREFINSLIKEKAKIGWQRKFTLEEEKRWLTDTIRKNREGKNINLVVEIDNRFVGSIGVRKKILHAQEHVCDLGATIAKEYRGPGIGKEAMKTLCKLGRDVLKCKIATLTVYDNNDVAKHVYNKIGFKEFGKLPKGCNYYGKYFDGTYMYKDLGK